MVKMIEPVFPIVVEFLEDGTVWTLESVSEVETNLEWFDSEDPEENAVVRDANNRLVSLKVKQLQLIEFKYKNCSC